MILSDIIYVNFNSTDCLIRSIECLLGNISRDHRLNIIVVDNASTDDVTRAKARFPEIKLFTYKKNIGFGAAINRALRYCDSKYVTLINPDCFISKNFFEIAIGFMEKNESIGIIGPKIMDEDGSVQGSARSFPTPLTSLFGRKSPLTRIFPNNSITKSNILTWADDNESPREVDWVSGACMVIRRNAIENINGFDEHFFLYWEDTDLCRRVRNKGWKVVYFPFAKATHIVGMSSSTKPIFSKFHFHKSGYRLFEKYATWPYSLLSPFAGVALMLRFLISVLFSFLRLVVERATEADSKHIVKTKISTDKTRVSRNISKMKVLHVYKDFYPPVKGGIESHINLLSTGLMRRGIDVEVLVSNTINRYEKETYNGINIHKAPQLGRFSSAPLTPTFYRYLKRFGESADIIHFHYPNPTAEFSYFLTNLHKKLVVTYHSDIIRQDKLGKIYSPFRKVFLDKADRIISTSPNYIESSAVLNKYKDKCTVIPLGIDIERFRSYEDRFQINEIKRRYGTHPIVLFVGCFRYYKGLHYLLSAMRRINAVLLLIGAGPEESKLRRFVDRNHLGEKIHFLGELPDDDVNAYYQACDIFVLPSHLRSEAFGIVQLEAMCCKKPVISTKLGTGTSFVNLDQKTGIVIRPADDESLSNAIQFLIDNPGKRKSYGESGYKRVKDLFSNDTMVERTLQLYQEITRKPIVKDRQARPHIGKSAGRQIKVLRLVSRMNIGGPAIHVKNLTECLDKSKFDTKLITGSISSHEGDMSYIVNVNEDTLIHIPELQREIEPLKELISLKKVIKTIRSFKPDIVHSHTSKAGTIARIAVILCNFGKKEKIISIHTFHGHILDSYFNIFSTYLFNLIERMLGKYTDRIIAISESQKWELLNLYRISRPEKIVTIKLGFDLQPFLQCYERKYILRKRIGVSDDTILIGIVGRLVPIKNHKMFLDSASLLLKKTKDRKIHFLIIGDGELRQSLEKYAIENDLADHVIFYGWEKNIPMIYADLDILALTSLNEGTPVSIIEAMAASVPVVTTDVGGIKDLLGVHQPDQPVRSAFRICKRGIMCPKDDAVTFCNALMYMIESGYLNDRKRFDKAKRYVVENYSIARLVEDIEGLYNRLMMIAD